MTTDNPGKQVTHLYYGASGLAESRDIRPGGRGQAWYHRPNWRGDTALLTNQPGRSAHEYFYTSYGELLDNNSQLQDSSNFTGPHNRFTLSGKELDAESGLTYFGVRHYDAGRGNWTTADPLRGPLNDPLQRNRYLFNRSNPLRYVDPIGTETYTVQPDDNLSDIAAQFGDSAEWLVIYALNLNVIGGNPNVIQPGQNLYIPWANMSGGGSGGDGDGEGAYPPPPPPPPPSNAHALCNSGFAVGSLVAWCEKVRSGVIDPLPPDYKEQIMGSLYGQQVVAQAARDQAEREYAANLERLHEILTGITPDIGGGMEPDDQISDMPLLAPGPGPDFNSPAYGCLYTPSTLAHNSDFLDSCDAIEWVKDHAAQIILSAHEQGVPPELVAGILAAEIDFDTDISDIGLDTFINYLFFEVYNPFIPPFKKLINQGIIQGYMNLEVGVGVAQIHYGTYEVVRDHYNDYSCNLGNILDPNVQPLSQFDWTWAALTSQGAIDVVSTYGRMGADYRTGDASQPNLQPHFDDLTTEDMAFIFGAYRQGIGELTCDSLYCGYFNIEDFQNRPDLGPDASQALPYFEYFQAYFQDLLYPPGEDRQR